MKKLSKDFVYVLIFVFAVFALITFYYNKNFVMYQIKEETKKDLFGNYLTYSEEDAEAIKKITEAYFEIKDVHVFEQDSKELVDSAIEGMTKATKDKYTSYTPIQKEEEMASQALTAEYYGIGVEVSVTDGYPTVLGVFKNSPAEEVGIKVNDKIIKAANVKYENQKLEDYIDLIKGAEGTKVDITILRNGAEIELEVERRKVNRETVSYEEKEGIPYIDVDGFYDTTGDEFKEAMRLVDKTEKKEVIIDLRDNSGGYLDSAKSMVSEFLGAGEDFIIFEYKDKKDVKKTILGKNRKDYKVKILINENTASASEVFTLALKEKMKNVEIIGEKSFGKGLIQGLKTMNDGSELKVTMAKWLSPNGVWLEEGKGIEPNKEIQNEKIYGLIGFNFEDEEYLQYGDEKEIMIYIKNLMKIEGYKITEEDEKFDRTFEEEYKKFEEKNGLKVDGKIKKEDVEKISEKMKKYTENEENDKQLKEALK